VLPHEGEPDTSRFDSGAFTFPEPAADLLGPEVTQPVEPLHGRPSATNAIAVSAINRADDDSPRGTQHTADLLEALRRRRGEREAATFDDQHGEPPASEQRTEPLTPLPFRLVEESITVVEEKPAPAPTPAASPAPTPSAPADDAHGTTTNTTGPAPSSRKKGRAAMPSWDEIVFGARTDDDLA
jgi:hypothetical protein